jgi:hypothetical protein
MKCEINKPTYMLKALREFLQGDREKKIRVSLLKEFIVGIFSCPIGQGTGQLRLLEIELLSDTTLLYLVDVSTIEETDFTSGDLQRRSRLYDHVIFLETRVGQLMGDDPYFILMLAPEQNSIYFEGKAYRRMEPRSRFSPGGVNFLEM